METGQSSNRLYGTVDWEEYRENSLDFYQSATSIASHLGRKSHLVERYVQRALQSLNGTDGMSVLEDGHTSARRLRSIVRSVVTGEVREDVADHPFMKIAASFIKKKPLKDYSTSARCAMYVLALSDLWIDHAVEQEVIALVQTAAEEKESPDDADRFLRQCNEIFDEQETMAVFEQRFMARCRPVSPVSLFLEGFTSEMNFTMTEHDEDTARSVFSLWLDSGIGLYDGK